MKKRISNLFHVLRKGRKKSIAVGLLVVLILSFTVAVFLNLPERAEAAWFDDTFGYRHRVSFTHNAALTNQSVTFTLDTAELITAGLMQADCDDTRFTDANGSLLLFDLTGTCDNASTTYEVIFPTIVNGSNLFYVYYGSPTAANAEIDSTGFTALTPSGGDPSLTNPTSSGNQEKSQGPVAYYSFDEGYGSTAQDGSGNNYDGTITGAAWQTENMCVSEKCLWFDGSNDFIDTADIPSLYGSSSMTISLWFKQNLASALKALITKADFQTQDAWALQTDDTDADELQFYVFNHISTDGGTNSMSTTNANLSDGIWYHLVVVYDGTQSSSNRVKFYLNGRQLSTSVEGTIPTTLTSATSTVKIGQWGGTLTRNFNGFLDNIAIYSYAKSATQVQADFTAKDSSKGASSVFGSNPQNNPNALTNLLTGYWSLDEATANTCTGGSNDSCDKSTYGNDGTWNGNATSASGKFGSGVVFDGTGDYVNLGQNSTIKTGDAQGNLTIAAWVKLNSDYTSTQTILSNTSSSGSGGNYLLEFGRTDNKFTFVSDANVDATSNGTISDNNWHHIVFTRLVNGSNRTLSFYIDGVFDSATDTTANSGGGANTSIGRAGDFDGNYFNGTIDEVRFYKRTLSSSDVSALYNWAPGPVGYWKLDESSGSTTRGSGSVGFASTISGNPVWVPGKFGSGLNMDGTGDNVTITDHASLDLRTTKDYTWSYWVRPEAFTEWQSTWTQTQTGTAYVQIYTHTTSDAFWGPVTAGFSVCWTNGINTIYTCRHTTNNVLSLNTWAHVSVAYDSSQAQASRFRIYVNGTDVTDTSDNQSTGSLPNISPDLTAFGEGNGDLNFDGTMDDVKFYNYLRTPKQIVEDMNAGHPAGGSPIASQLIYYAFDEQQGSTANNSNPAQSGITASITEALWNTGTSCKINGCLNFDGTNDVATVTNTSAIDLNEGLASGFTISAWVNPDTVGESSNGRFFAKNTNTYCQLSGSTPFNIRCNLDLATDADVSVTSAIPASTWTHVAMTWSNDADDEISVYINGRFRGVSTNGVGPTSADTASLLIGGSASNNWDGKIDEFKVYNSELTASEILIDMNAGSSTSLGGVLGSQDNEGFGGNPPVAHWKFDEGTGTSSFDTSGNGNTGTLTGNPGWQAGKLGRSVFFDGNNQYINAGTGSSLNTSNVFTISGWVKPGSSGTNRTIYVSQSVNVASDGIQFRLNSSNQLELLQANVSSVGTTSQALTSSLWSHVAITYDGSGNYRFYINGHLVTSGTNAQTFAYGTHIIGGRGTSSDEDYIGQIDDLKIYNYVRTQAQIAYDYNRGAPVAHWEFDECQGTTAYDTAPSAHNGTAGSNLTISVGGNGDYTSAGTCGSGTATESWNAGTTGKFNSSFAFDGNDDLATNTSPTNLPSGDVDKTISGWFNKTACGDIEILGGFGDPSDGANYQIEVCQDDQFRVMGWGASFDWSTDVSSTPYLDGKWHMVTVTYEASLSKTTLYVDGAPKATTLDFVFDTNPTTVVIGDEIDQNDRKFAGKIDDFRIYSYSLSPTHVKTLYNNGAVFFGPATGSP